MPKAFGDKKMWKNYEYYAIDYHRRTTNHITYHWDSIPEEILEEAGFIHDYNKHRLNRLAEKKKRDENKNYVREYGLDGISFDGSAYYGLQMKYWAKNSTITANDLGTFHNVIYSRMRVSNPNNAGYLYYSCRLEINLREDYMNAKIIKPVYLEFQQQEEKKEVKEIKKPWRHQIEAIKLLIKDYNNRDEDYINIKLLQLPCGTGKTMTTVGFIKNIQPDFIIVIAPLRLSVNQFKEAFTVFKELRTEYKSILVDTDGITDANIIKQELKTDKKVVIFTTFDSAENVLMNMDIPKTFIVVDEAHNLINNKLVEWIESFDYGLMLTATPPSIMMEIISYETIYEYTIAEAIAEKRICDYLVYVPYLADLDDDVLEYDIDLEKEVLSKAAFLFTGMLKTGSRRCIGYFSNKEECTVYENAFQLLAEHHGLKLWTDSINCEININSRKKMLADFQGENFDIYIICSVRILDEAIDLPKCDSEFISSVSDNTSEIRLVQRLMRGSRLDKENPNKVNHLFLWSDYNKKIFSLLKENDPDFHKKIKCGGITYRKQKEKKETIKQEILKLDNYVKYECISLEEAWDLMLDKVKKFIDENKKRPTLITNKKLNKWLSHQITNHKKKPMLKFAAFLTQYREYFKSNTEVWYENLTKVKNYIDINKKTPSASSNEQEIKYLGRWLTLQKNNYKKGIYIMKQDEINIAFTKFLEEYLEYLLTGEELWFENLTKLKNYIDTNKKTPSSVSKYPEIKFLGGWLLHQQKNYKKRIYIMQQDEINIAFTEFLTEYSEYFKSNTESWYEKLAKVKEYIDTNKKTPSAVSKDPETKTLGHWLSAQQTNYKKRIYIMKQDEINIAFTEFLTEYGEYFKSNTEVWFENLTKVKEYIDLHKKTPSSESKDTYTKSLGVWLTQQKGKYKKQTNIMKDDEINIAFTEFLEEYKEYCKSNTKIWYENLTKVKEYIDLNKKTPSCFSKDTEIKVLGRWLSVQQTNYKKRIYIMKQDEINIAFTEFLTEYGKYFKSNTEVWFENLTKVKEYIDLHKKTPSGKNQETKTLIKWLSHQKENYKKQTNIMKDDEINIAFTEFLEEYQEYIPNADEILEN